MNGKRLALIILILLQSSFLAAEWLFIDDGSIIQGTVRQETDKNIFLQTKDGLQNFDRSRVIRINYSADFKKTVYLYRTGLPNMTGHVVEETDNHYIIRQDLASSREEKIAKSSVAIISNEPVQQMEDLNQASGQRFRNLFGFGLGIIGNYQYREEGIGTLFNGTHIITPAVIAFRLYYYDRWFDMSMTYGIGIPDNYENPVIWGGNLFQFETAFYPFMNQNIHLGFAMGYTMHKTLDFKDGSSPRDQLQGKMIMVGLVWKNETSFRTSLSISLPGIKEIDTPNGNQYINNQWLDGHYTVSAFLNMEFFILSNFSLKIDYMFHHYYIQSRDELYGNFNYIHHSVMLMASYGFNL